MFSKETGGWRLEYGQLFSKETGVRTIVLQGEMKLKYTTLQVLLRTVEIQGRNGTVWI